MYRVTNFFSTLIVAALLLTVGGGTSSSAPVDKTCAPKSVARVASDATYPPFESANDQKNGAIEGFDIDLLNAIAKSQGFSIAVTNEDFSTIFVKLAQANYDLVISAVTITADRQKTVDFSNPYFLSSQAIVVSKDNAAKYKTTDDLQGLKIGVQKGTTGEDFATNNIKGSKVSSYTTAPEALQALANKDVDAVIMDTPIALNIIAEQPQLNLVVARRGLTVEKYGIAVRKECRDLLKKVNAGLGAVVADGTYNKLYRQYFGEDAPDEFLSSGSAVSTQAATTTSSTDCAPAALIKTLATLKTAGDVQRDLDALLNIEQSIKDLDAACKGFSFKGVAPKVIGPISIPTGSYIVHVVTSGYFIAMIKTLSGTCTGSDNTNGLFNLTAGDAATGADTTFDSTNCRMVIVTSNVSSAWTLTFTAIQ